jgi:PEP-CTERM motif
LLTGASALAILASAAEANAETFAFTGAAQSFTASLSGEYAVELLGASGGNSIAFNSVGGLGAEVSGDVFLTAGEDLTLFVGGQGQSATSGGGGGSFVFHGTDVLAVAGGGGGALVLDGGPGLAGTSGGTGGRRGGGTGMDGTGGGGGAANGGGGGAGVKAGSSGYGGDSQFLSGGFGGKFPNGGAAGGGGGGSGFSGGGGGGYGGGGGGSYLSKLFTDPVLTTGGASRGGNGSISVELLKAVPEPSTWAMTLMGFGGLGWLARARGRKTSPA